MYANNRRRLANFQEQFALREHRLHRTYCVIEPLR